MRIVREPDRERADDADSIKAYNQVSRWPIFTLERHILLKSLTKIKPKGYLIDVGCGPGYLAAQISLSYADLKVVGLDNSELTTKIAKSNWSSGFYNNLEFIIGDAQRLPISNDSVDFVISSLSLHHWEDGQEAFREIHRVLEPGGRFLIFDLRRDAPRYFYFALKIGQVFLAPRAIRNINGAIGSFWAAYKPSEIKTMLNSIPVENLRIEPQLGWILISGSKVRRPQS
jgi:ubiquinone/menaquinone biosynthesis C-methylase UbiE